MNHQLIDLPIEVFSTCPQSADMDRQSYPQAVINVARWSEKYGCKGILVYADNRLVDPWLVSQIIIQQTARLCPLVAVQPVYMTPFAAAKMVSSLGHFYDRRIYLNMLAGGFKNDLIALNDPAPHDRRYGRMVEYTTIIKRLLKSNSAITFAGEFYQVTNLKLSPQLPPHLLPGILVSGSSEAGLAAAKSLGATAVHYPLPLSDDVTANSHVASPSGIRIGIITRCTEDEAWKIAHDRFPEDRKGQIAHQLAMKVSDSSWHKQLSTLAEETKAKRMPYWLWPFENFKTFCPYLVGSYEQVATELSRYMKVGHRTFILDIPPTEEELHHTAITFERAVGPVAK